MDKEQRIREPIPAEQSAASVCGQAAARPPVAEWQASDTITQVNGRAKGGAPARNVNAQAHGVWSFLALGRLPKGASYIRRLMGELRSQLEKSVVESHGKISLDRAATITSVCRHEGRALLLSRYLAKEGDGLKILERMNILEAIGRATDARDKAIKALDLGRGDAKSLWDALDARIRRGELPLVTSISPTADASNAIVGVRSDLDTPPTEK